MTHHDIFVSVVVPLYNDGDIVDGFVAEVAGVLAEHYLHREIILVDDASTDHTSALADDLIARHPECRLLRLSRRFGTEVAIAAGLENAIGDYVAVMSPESDPAELVPSMVDRCREGSSVVTGIRTDRQGEAWLHRVGVRLFYLWSNRLLGVGIPPNATHFKVLSRQVVSAILRIRDGNRYLRTLTMHIGYSTAEIPYRAVSRRIPPRRKRLRDSLALALNITIANSSRPLYLAAAVGAILAGFNAVYLGYLVVTSLARHQVATAWTTPSMLIAAMFGSLALMGAIACTYLGRLLEERSDRPPYFVSEERNVTSIKLDELTRNVVSETVTR